MDNNPFQPQPQFQPAQPQPPISPPTQAPPPEQPNSNKKYLVIGASILVFLLVVAGISFAVSRGGEGKGFANLGQEYKQTDWLSPKQEVKVGSARYVSPCQALSLANMSKIYDGFGEDGYISEEYLDQTPPAKVTEARSRCHYVIDNEKFKDASLTISQFVKPDDVKPLYRSVGLTDPSDAEEEVANYKKYTDDSNSQAAKDFVKRLEISTATFKKYDKVYDAKELAELKTDGLVIPGRLGLTIFYGAAVYTYEASPKNSTKQLSNEQIVAEIVRLKKVVDTIEKNARNDSLSQSPVQTILGTSDKIGETTLLEPCAILTSDNFATITGGRQQNDTVSRLTTKYDIDKDRYATRDKSQLFTYNTCTRQYDRRNDIAASTTAESVSVELELQYAKTEQAAKDYLNKYYPVKGGDIQLQTKADWAVNAELGADPAQRYYFFRVGPYIAQVSIRKLVSAGLSDPIKQYDGTPEEHLAAINELTASLKSHRKAAEAVKH